MHIDFVMCKNFAKIVFSKLIKSPMREIFGTFLHGQKGHSVAVLFFKILNCLGELGLEKNSRNFYKCRGMSRFGEKKLYANNKASLFARRLKNMNKTTVKTLFLLVFSRHFSSESARLLQWVVFSVHSDWSTFLFICSNIFKVRI